MFNAINVSASGLTAERLRMDVISKNIANANTTRTVNGTPYRRQTVTFETKSEAQSFQNHLSDQMKKFSGVEVTGIQEDQSPFKNVYEPGHPDANEEGYVQKPNVDIVTEMTNMISATRAYEANITSIDSAKNMAQRALQIGR